MTPLLLLVELTGLLFLSRLVVQKLYTFFLLVFRSRSVAVSIVTLLLFPGTVVHELSHLFTAEILGVRTGKLSLAPESIRGDPSTPLRASSIKTGSITIAQTGPIRRAAIGLAPIFAGITTLTAISYFLKLNFTALQGPTLQLALIYGLSFYLLFTISNSMFSSREDMRGFWPLAITLGLFAGAAYFVGLRIGLEGKALEVVTTILSSLVQSLGLVLALNSILLLTLHVLVVLTRKLPR